MKRHPSRPARLRNGRSKPTLEALEGRQLLTTFTVTNTADAGAGSLRSAIMAADADTAAGVDAIDFAIPGGGIQTIRPASELPVITRPTLIDGTTQPGYAITPVVVLDGSVASTTFDPYPGGLTIEGTDSTVRGLAIVRFPGTGIYTNAGSVTIQGDFIGIDPSGTPNGGNGNFGIRGGEVVIAQNVISGNAGGGIDVSSGSLVVGNRIGTDPTGSHAVGNFGPGISLELNTVAVTIGGTALGAGNVISGNTGGGIEDLGFGHLIEGNLIGTDATGLTAIGNLGSGIDLESSAGAAPISVPGGSYNTIGGTVAGAGNLISANSVDGIHGGGSTPTRNYGFYFLVPAASADLIQGNRIGTDLLGRPVLANAAHGIAYDNNQVAPQIGKNTIGGTALGAGNVLNDINGSAIRLPDPTNSTGNVVAGNTLLPVITVTTTADDGVGSLRAAILAADADPAPGVDTIVFAIPGGGIPTIKPASPLPAITRPTFLDGATQPGYAITPLVVLDGSAAGMTSGLTIQGAGSTVQGLAVVRFQKDGIDVSGDGVTIKGDFLGIDPGGAPGAGNSGDGLQVTPTTGNDRESGTSGTIIALNVISGNSGNGIADFGLGSLIVGNRIGTDPSGSLPVGNGENGIALEPPSVFFDLTRSTSDTVGGTALGAGNLISGNGGDGIDEAGLGDLIEGNFIGTNAAGLAAIGNLKSGIELVPEVIDFDGGGVGGYGGASDTIGGTATSAGNLISANSVDGIHGAGLSNFGGLDGIFPAATENLIQGNRIGLDATGSPTLPNAAHGIGFDGTDAFDVYRTPVVGDNTIGGTSAGAGNVLNDTNGSAISLPDPTVSTGNVVVGNLLIRSRFTVVNTLDSGPGSLRAAILGADLETFAGPVTIDFAIPGGGIKTIKPASPLPAITRPTFLDGTTQPGYAGTPLVVLDGVAAGPSSGLTIQGQGSTVIGLAVVLFRGDGIDVDAPDVTIAGDWVGLEPADSSVASNAKSGVVIGAAGASILGNVISGNGDAGIADAAPGSLIQSNRIGTDPTATRALGNGTDGLLISSTNETVGGTTPGLGNVLSGNDGAGVFDTGGMNRFEGNVIGADVSGLNNLLNGGGGIVLGRNAGDTIGGNVLDNIDGRALVLQGPGTATNNMVGGNFVIPPPSIQPLPPTMILSPPPSVVVVTSTATTPGFGRVGQPATLRFAVTNLGTTPVAGLDLVLDLADLDQATILGTGPYASALIAGLPGFLIESIGTLAPGASALIPVTFVPIHSGPVGIAAGLAPNSGVVANPLATSSTIGLGVVPAAQVVQALPLVDRGKVYALKVTFDVPLNGAVANDPRNYHLTIPRQVGRGKHQKVVNVAMPIKTVTYHPARHVIVLTLAPSRHLPRPGTPITLVVGGPGSVGLVDALPILDPTTLTFGGAVKKARN